MGMVLSLTVLAYGRVLTEYCILPAVGDGVAPSRSRPAHPLGEVARYSSSVVGSSSGYDNGCAGASGTEIMGQGVGPGV